MIIMKRQSVLAGFILALIFSVGVQGQPSLINAAQQLFELYVRLSHEFDPSLANLYSDDALIQNTRIDPNGVIRVMTMPASVYKATMPVVMPLAKLQGDISTYTNVTFSLEENGVRIEATRYSVMKDYESPFSLLVARSDDGKWRIHEEITQSQP